MTPADRTRHLILLAALLLPLAAPSRAQTPPAQSPTFNGIAHIAIRVKDIAASVDFYNKLGFEQAFAMTRPDGTVTQSFLKINDTQFIELYPINPSNPTQDKPEFLHLCFEGTDLNALHDFYVAEGLTPIAVRKAGAGNLLFTMKGPLQFRDPQNIEYTQYQPGSLHSNDTGKHLGPDRVGDKMLVVALSMQDPAAAKAFYTDKLGFVPVAGGSRIAARLGLPGSSGESVEIVPVETLEAKSSIVLETPSLDKAAAQLTRRQVPFQRAASEATGSDSKTARKEMIAVTDPDGNIIRIQPHQQ